MEAHREGHRFAIFPEIKSCSEKNFLLCLDKSAMPGGFGIYLCIVGGVFSYLMQRHEGMVVSSIVETYLLLAILMSSLMSGRALLSQRYLSNLFSHHDMQVCSGAPSRLCRRGRVSHVGTAGFHH